jgi:uncharacterized protein YjiS (DUF1127 family)
MNTQARSFDQLATRMGFTGILQGHYVSEKVYGFIQKVDGAMSAAKILVQRWVSNSAGRRELARLDAHMLRDIGLEPYEVQREISKPFWRS